MGMKNAIVKAFKAIIDKKVCTAQEFADACDIAKAKALKDPDQIITIGDGGKIIVETIYDVKKR